MNINLEFHSSFRGWLYLLNRWVAKYLGPYTHHNFMGLGLMKIRYFWWIIIPFLPYFREIQKYHNPFGDIPKHFQILPFEERLHLNLMQLWIRPQNLVCLWKNKINKNTLKNNRKNTNISKTFWPKGTFKIDNHRIHDETRPDLITQLKTRRAVYLSSWVRYPKENITNLCHCFASKKKTQSMQNNQAIISHVWALAWEEGGVNTTADMSRSDFVTWFSCALCMKWPVWKLLNVAKISSKHNR